MTKRLSGSTDDLPTSDIDITPMLDVVFILLIFFIVSATFIKESGIDTSRPHEPSASVVVEQDSILIDIDANNDIWVNRRNTDIRRVSASIERLRAEHLEAKVVIVPHKASHTDTLIRTMDASRLADVYNISIAKGE